MKCAVCPGETILGWNVCRKHYEAMRQAWANFLPKPMAAMDAAPRRHGTSSRKRPR